MKNTPTVVPQKNAPMRTSRRMRVGWIISLIVLCLLIMGFQVVNTRSIDVPLAQLAGRLTVDALFITIGFIAMGKLSAWLLVGRQGRTPSRSPKVIAFAAIFASLFLGAIAGPRVGNRQNTATISMIENELARFERESVDEKGFPVRTPGPNPTVPLAAGKFETPEQVLQHVFARGEAARNEYLAELEAIQWDSILDPARLERDAMLAEGRKMVKQAENIVARQEVRMQDFFAEIREHIRALPLPDEEKRGMLDGFDGSFAGSNFAELQKLERQVVGHISDLIEVLDASQYGVGWTVKNGEIGFINEDAMNEYNSHIDALQQTVAKQEQMTVEHRERAKKRLGDMKR